MRTPSMVTPPLSVSRWPMLSQSSWKVSPGLSEGTMAKMCWSVPSRTPSSTVTSETLLPVEKVLAPVKTRSSPSSVTTTSLSRGLTAPPKNQVCRTASASTCSHCSRVPTRRAAQFQR
ncbi:hypothetical protein GA0115255_109551 [Streptomyces sp. Ncost-T6T-2b]|nr:hypothetical protein GA0115255_109551 [Streptomyces sp. Ncost-T6T-2b]